MYMGNQRYWTRVAMHLDALMRALTTGIGARDVSGLNSSLRDALAIIGEVQRDAKRHARLLSEVAMAALDGDLADAEMWLVRGTRRRLLDEAAHDMARATGVVTKVRDTLFDCRGIPPPERQSPPPRWPIVGPGDRI